MHIVGEHYHVYNRGAHKAQIFFDVADYERFVRLLFMANDTHSLPAKWNNKFSWVNMSKENLVEVFAYCLMPNHFHIGLRESRPDGIEEFMRRVCTSYAMYYNKKYKHSGTIFQGGCKSKHVDTDPYLRILIDYIHLNPYGIEEPELMKNAIPEYRTQAIECSKKYEYSSFKDYLGETRPQRLLLTLFEVSPRR